MVFDVIRNRTQKRAASEKTQKSVPVDFLGTRRVATIEGLSVRWRKWSERCKPIFNVAREKQVVCLGHDQSLPENAKLLNDIVQPGVILRLGRGHMRDLLLSPLVSRKI